VSLSFAPGFPMADFEECGMSVVGYGEDAAATVRAVEELKAAIDAAERDFVLDLRTPDDAVRAAMARGEPGRPIVLADTQDNPGAGGNGDTTGHPAALLRHEAQDAVLGLLIDPASACTGPLRPAKARQPDFALGEILGAVPGHAPLPGRLHLGRAAGQWAAPPARPDRCTGVSAEESSGRMALLRQQGGVRAASATYKPQAADEEMFRDLGGPSSIRQAHRGAREPRRTSGRTSS
jgi:microcystin degradation protein MlrC